MKEYMAIELLEKAYKDWIEDKDTEHIHLECDLLLVRFLEASGYNDLASKYKSIRDEVGFWYA